MSNLFAVATSYTVGIGLWGVAIADVNADGKPDIVATNGGVTTVSVLLNSGTGTTLAFAMQVTYSVGSGPYGVAIADVNADGKPDIVTANQGSNTVSVLLNSGTGTTLAFATQVTYSVGSYPVGVAIADVNADGKPDIVAANNGGGTVSVLLNSGTGTTLAFATQVTYSVGSEPWGVAIADVNADGKPDIVATNNGGNTVSVLLNSGTGTTLAFATQVTYTVGSNPDGVAIADVNADGKPDIVAANYVGNTVSVLLNSGTGTTLAFATQVTYSVGSGPYGVAIADVNADGKPDIVATNYGGGTGNTVSVLLNSGTGTTLAFATQVTYSVGSNPQGVAIADVNADGKPDIVDANYGGGTVSVLLNSGHTPTRTVSHTTTRTSSRSEVSRTSTHTLSKSQTSSLSEVSRTPTPSITPTESSTPSLYTTLSPSQASYTLSSSSTPSSTYTSTSSLVPTSTLSTTVSLKSTHTITSTHTSTNTLSLEPSNTQSSTLSLTQHGPAVIDLQDSSATNILRISGPNDAYTTRFYASNIGDINHDGRDDIMLSTWKVKVSATEDGPSCSSENYVVFGQAHILDFPTNVLSLNGTLGFKVLNSLGFSYGQQADGRWIAECQSTGVKAGDINGDRIADFIIGNSKAGSTLNTQNLGSVWALFGRTTGFGSLLDLGSLAGSDGLQIIAEARALYTCARVMHINPEDCAGAGRMGTVYTERNLGQAISAIGDIDGDNRSDIVIGDPWPARDTSTGNLLGELNAIYSNALSSPVFDVDELAGPNGFKMRIRGIAVSSTCDINGDGRADIVTNNPNGLGSVIYTPKNSSGLYNSTLNGTKGFNIVGALGGYKMSIVTGDIDGDGRCDIIISVPAQGANTIGHIYAILNKGNFTAEFNVDDFDGANGFRMDGTDKAKNFGISIALGDVNGDGILDIIVAEGDDACVSNNVYVILGRENFYHPFKEASLNGWTGYKVINIPGCGAQGMTVSSGDIDGNGKNDVLIGAGAQTIDAEAFIIFS